MQLDIKDIVDFYIVRLTQVAYYRTNLSYNFIVFNKIFFHFLYFCKVKVF